MAFKAGRLPKMGSPICPYAGCYSPKEPCIGACRSSESEQVVDHATGQVAYAAPSEKQEPDKRDRLEIMMDLVAANKRIYDLEGQLREAQAQREGWMKAAQSLIL